MSASTILFQFSPLREGRRSCRPVTRAMANFNSRPCERGDLAYEADELGVGAFQFSPLREGRRGHAQVRHHEPDFNSRPCERGDAAGSGSPCPPSRFQFSPLREGRLHCGYIGRVVWTISILAPARGATKIKFKGGFVSHISILAPARGATLWGCRKCNNSKFQFSPLREGRHLLEQALASRCYFNSRPCERGDVCLDHVRLYAHVISILAPARGATAHSPPSPNIPSNFNSRPCERGDRRCATAWRAGGRFQFSPLREGRRKKAFTSLALFYFNSRPCERGDIFLFALQ